MVNVDWKRIMAIRPDEMSEQEKDDWYEPIAWYTPESNTDRKSLNHLLRVAQEILKFKAEQVESLMNELDDIASKQGEEEARRRQDLIDEIEDLKEQLEYQKRLGKDTTRPSIATSEGLRSEMVKLEMQNEELLFELQEREKELMNEKAETENFASQVASLEREKQELTRELTALQEEATERLNARSIRDSPEFGPEKQEELTDLIRQKNKHITQLLDDIDTIEKENMSLRTKLTSVRDELAETTTNITEMTMEISKLRHLNEDHRKKITSLEEQNKGLTSQISELVEEKANHDKQLDEFAVKLNSKVLEWKNILDSKDNEISKMKEELKKSMSSSSMIMSSDVEMHQKILEQEEQIKVLKSELSKATEEINSCTEIIGKLKARQAQMKSGDSDQPQSQLVILEDKIAHLESKLKYAEEDAQVKAEEMSDMVIQIRELESGEFGLSEAISKIKKLEKQAQRKDAQIEKLIENCNYLEMEFQKLEEQNMTMRDKLGISATEEIDTSHVKLKFRNDMEVMENLKLQLEKKEEELLKYKLKNRKLVKFLKRDVEASNSDESSARDVKELEKLREENYDLEQKLISMTKENEALRKGMHEILESIHNQDGASRVEIQSSCLERLLEALDSRHLSGWYHPAMRLQAQLKTVQGNNEELRNQIRALRTDDDRKENELQEALMKIQALESDVMSLQQEEERPLTKTPVDEDKNDNYELERKMIELEMTFQELKLMYDKKNAELENVESSIQSEVLSRLEEVTRPDGESSTVLERQLSYLKDVEATHRRSVTMLRDSLLETEGKLLEQIVKIQKDKLLLLLRLEEAEKELWRSVPREKLEEAQNEASEATRKYQEVVSCALARRDDTAVEHLQQELKLVQDEKQSVLDELRIVKEKLIAAEGVLSDAVTRDASSEMANLAGKLAASEVRELNEKHKSSHLEKVNIMIRAELQEVEAHNGELMESIQGWTEANGKLQGTLRDLQAQIGALKNQDDYQALCDKVESLSKKLQEVQVEKENMQELLEISQGQCRSLQAWREAEKQQTAAQSELLLLLSSSDDKTIVARLSHELLTSQMTSSQHAKTISELNNKIQKLETHNMCVETRKDELRRELCEIKRKHLGQVEYLYEVIHHIRQCSNLFPNLEKVYRMKAEVQRERQDTQARLEQLKLHLHEYSVKREEIEIQLEALDDLKAALNGDSGNLVTWHNRGTELRLKEARARRQNEFLVGEMSQMEIHVKKLNEEVMILEEKGFEKEKEWEDRQKLWEEAQYELCQLLQGKTVKPQSTAVSVRDESTATENQNQDDSQIQDLQAEVAKLRSQIEEQEAAIVRREKAMSKPKTLELEETVSRDKTDEAEKAALKVTVQSLQNIIKQKEETIFKYQDLLKEGRDEHSKASGKLQDELKNLHEALTNQSKAYSRLKNSIHQSQQGKDNTPLLLEKYITRMHELEDELTECQSNLSALNNQLSDAQQEADRWRNVAGDRLVLMEDMRQRLEIEYKKEIENFKEEIQNYQGEVEHLKELLDSHHYESADGHNRKLIEAIQQLQAKLLQYEGGSHHKSDWGYDRNSKAKEIESFKRQLKVSKEESTRLREQIRALQIQKAKRPRTAGSSTTRSGSDSKSSLREETLQSKVKTLEELLQVSKERERELLETAQQRIKSAEEVARWDEKKRWQHTVDHLSSRLKERELEMDILKNKNESFRNIIQKCEKDRAMLESQLKSARSGTRLNKLLTEKAQLEEEVASLKDKLETQQRHGGGLNAALLHEKLETQERKLAVLELSSQGQSYMVDELERLKTTVACLEKTNLKIESDNLSLELKLEREKSEVHRLTERNRELEKWALMQDMNEDASELRRIESDRTLASLHHTIEKLSADNKRLRGGQNKEPRMTGTVDRVRKELVKLKEDHKKLRNQYLEVVNRNSALEGELKKCRYQIHLLEEKDLAESISKTNNLQMTSDLSQELLQIKSQLVHKTHLLERVKVLLTKAAAKERALNEQVSALQSMVPRSAGRTQ